MDTKQEIAVENATVTGLEAPESVLSDAKQSDSDRQSNQHESEYDTASDSGSESGDYEDDLNSSEDELHSDLEGSSSEHGEEEGEGEEAEGEGADEEPKKVDDDEDRSNPQYIPKKGTFYEHDDRTADNPLGSVKAGSEEPVEAAESSENVSSAVSPLPAAAKPLPRKPAGGDKWSHDRFDMSEQAPKSRVELVSAYGYDIRSEDGPPKVKRSKHYGRGPTKYDRNWEDENAYGKQVVAKRVPRAPPKGEDFPRLNERRPKKPHNHSQSRDEPSLNNSAEGSEERTFNHNNNNNSNNNHSRDHRRQGGGRDRDGGGRDGGGGRDRDGGGRAERGGGGGYRGGNDKSREFKNRNPSGRGGRDGGSREPAGRLNRRREDSGRSGGGDQEQQQQTFNGMSFTNSSHGKQRLEASHQPRNSQAGGDERDDPPQRMIPTANASRSVNYGSGRLQRRDDKPMSQQQQQHYPQQQHHSHGGAVVAGELSGGLPLHAPVSHHHQQPQQQQEVQQMPKRYSEKRQGMRSELQNTQQSQSVQQVPVGMGGGMMGEVPREHLHQQQQQQALAQQQQAHLQQNTGPPPPPFMTNRPYAQMDVGPVVVSAVQQPQQQAPVPPQAQPIPAQYANYYPAEFLPQSTPAPTQQPTVATANGPPTQLLNYVPAMQAAPPPPQNPAQYSQYPGYQNYAAMPIQAPPPPSNVAYYAPAPPPAAAQAPPPQAQLPSRAILPQRRPTNAIPIVSPPDRNAAASGGKGRGRLASDVPGGGPGGDAAAAEGGGPVKGGDDIDHILDTMFVRRPQQAMTSSTTSSAGGRTKSEETDKVPSSSNSKVEASLDEGMKDLRLNEGGGDGGLAGSSET